MTKTPEELAEEFVNQEDTGSDTFAHGLRNGFLTGFQAAAPQWISVKDRLPEQDDEAMSVLISGEGWHNYEVAYFGPTAWYDKYDDVVEGVTHWMPLPKPPEE
jgi:hypothetical protein